MADRCENCTGMETTLNCITAASDIPGTDIKKGMTLGDILKLNTQNTTNSDTSQEVVASVFTPPTLYSQSTCAAELEGSLIKYDVSNFQTISKVNWNFCEILNSFPNTSYNFVDHNVKIMNSRGLVGTSSGNVGEINVEKEDYPVTLTTTVYVNTPCGQIKLENDTVIGSCATSSGRTSQFRATDLSHTSSTATTQEEYLANMSAELNNLRNKVQSMENNPIGCNETLDSINVSNLDLVTKCERLEKQVAQLIELNQTYDTQFKLIQNQIQDNNQTINSLNNLNSSG